MTIDEKIEKLERQVGKICDLTTEALERVSTLANLGMTLVECLGEITENADPEVKIAVAAKLGAFAMSEERDAD